MGDGVQRDGLNGWLFDRLTMGESEWIQPIKPILLRIGEGEPPGELTAGPLGRVFEIGASARTLSKRRLPVRLGWSLALPSSPASFWRADVHYLSSRAGPCRHRFIRQGKCLGESEFLRGNREWTRRDANRGDGIGEKG